MTAANGLTVSMLEARIDKLTEALFYVSSEVWATRDRQAVLERLLTDNGLIAPDLIDGYRPDTALATTLETEREVFVANVLGYLAPGD